MKNGKKRKNTFSEKNQPTPESKRVKKRKTILKEAIGLESWDGIQKYITGKGAQRFISAIHGLKGRDFAQAYLQAAEYFKPKLARTELIGDPAKPVEFTITRTILTKKV